MSTLVCAQADSESRLVLHTPCQALNGDVQLAKDVHDEHISKSDGTKGPK